MADNAFTATVKKVDWAFIWKVFLSIVVIVVIFLIVYWYRFLRGISWKNIKTLIATESAKYKTPTDVEHILLQGVKDIILRPELLIQARTYAKQSGISLDTVLVNNSIALAKEYDYLPNVSAT